MREDAIIQIRGLNFSYSEAQVLQDINLSIYQNEFIGIIGPNAGGKTTLLKLMLGLLKPESGTITIYGKTPKEVVQNIGYVPQYAMFSRDFPVTVEEVVMLGTAGKSQSEDRELLRKTMQAVGIDHISAKHIGALSGGQIQRVLVARALACRPKILILDEPTANIDIKAEENIFSFLKKYNESMTIIVVSHDVAFISSYVSRVACLNKTLICHDTESISGKMIEELYDAHINIIHHQHAI